MHAGFRSLATKIGDIERPSGRRYALFYVIWQLSEPTASNALKLKPRQKYSPESVVFGNTVYDLWRTMRAIFVFMLSLTLNVTNVM